MDSKKFYDIRWRILKCEHKMKLECCWKLYIDISMWNTNIVASIFIVWICEWIRKAEANDKQQTTQSKQPKR